MNSTFSFNTPTYPNKYFSWINSQTCSISQFLHVIVAQCRHMFAFLGIFFERKNHVPVFKVHCLQSANPMLQSQGFHLALRMAWLRTLSSQPSVETGASKSTFTVSSHSRGSGDFLGEGLLGKSCGFFCYKLYLIVSVI